MLISVLQTPPLIEQANVVACLTAQQALTFLSEVSLLYLQTLPVLWWTSTKHVHVVVLAPFRAGRLTETTAALLPLGVAGSSP